MLRARMGRAGRSLNSLHQTRPAARVVSGEPQLAKNRSLRGVPDDSGDTLVTTIDGPRELRRFSPPAYDRIKIDSLILQVLSSGTGGE